MQRSSSRNLLVASPGLIVPGRERDAFGLGIVPGIGGAERGYHSSADITRTQDGQDLNAIWSEFQDVLRMWNEARDPLVRLLTYGVTVASEKVAQGSSTAQFEDASEYGVPVGYRAEVSEVALGYTFKWKDLAFRYTWQYLADALSSQLASDQAMAMEADSREMFTSVMEAAFGNSVRTNSEGVSVFPWYAGANSVALDTPPTYGSTSFAGTHTHFLTSGSATVLAPDDVERVQDTITEHGYKRSRGNTLVLLAPKALCDQIRLYRSTANSGSGRYDFIPAQGQPSFLLPANTFTVDPGATRPANTYQGLDVVGSYGEFLIVEEPNIPAGYLFAFATGGQDSLPNPIAVREHSNAALRGLRLVKGRNNDYPLVDSYYARGFGTGIRHRGAGAVMQMTTSSYSVPSFR